MPSPPVHIPLPLGNDAQIGTPLYNWVYKGDGAVSTTFELTYATGLVRFGSVTSAMVTLGSITANGQKFFQYYYQVNHTPPTPPTTPFYSEGFVPADKLVAFSGTNLTFNQTASGPVSPAAKSKRGKDG